MIHTFVIHRKTEAIEIKAPAGFATAAVIEIDAANDCVLLGVDVPDDWEISSEPVLSMPADLLKNDQQNGGGKHVVNRSA